MKATIATVVVLLLLTTGCYSRADFVRDNPHIAEYKREAILARKMVVGMTLEEAEAAVGYRMRFIEGYGTRATYSCGHNLWVRFRNGQISGFHRLGY